MLVVVTGGAGRVGRALIPLLRAEDCDVRTFDANELETGGAWEHVCGDLRDLAAIRRVISGADAIVHAGAIAGDLRGQPERVLTANVQGTWNVVIAAVEAAVQRVVFLSSVNALGCFGGVMPAARFPIDDAYPRHPPRPYGLSKHLAEEVCRSFSNGNGIATVCLRPALITAPGRYPSWRSNPDGAEASLRHDFWAYVDERDVCDAVLRSLSAQVVGHHAFLLTAADTCASRPTADLVKEHYPDVPWPTIDPGTYTRGNPYRSLVDCSRARDVIGWQPRWSWRVNRPGAVRVDRGHRERASRT